MKNQFLGSISLLFFGGCCAFGGQFTWGNTYAQDWQGFGTGPYEAVLPGAGGAISIFCLDFNDSIGPPNTWNANVWVLNQHDVQTEAQYGGNYNNLLNNAYGAENRGQPAPNQIVNLSGPSEAYASYLEAAWLFTEMQSAGAQSNLAEVAQVAAWELFVNPGHQAELTGDIQASNAAGNIYGFQDFVDPAGSATATVTGLNFEQAANYFLGAAQNAVVTKGTFTGAGWTIVTADPTWVESSAGGTIPAQEFLSPNAMPISATSSIPEPSPLVLVATAFGLIGFAKCAPVALRCLGRRRGIH